MLVIRGVSSDPPAAETGSFLLWSVGCQYNFRFAVSWKGSFYPEEKSLKSWNPAPQKNGKPPRTLFPEAVRRRGRSEPRSRWTGSTKLTPCPCRFRKMSKSLRKIVDESRDKSLPEVDMSDRGISNMLDVPGLCKTLVLIRGLGRGRGRGVHRPSRVPEREKTGSRICCGGGGYLQTQDPFRAPCEKVSPHHGLLRGSSAPPAGAPLRGCRSFKLPLIGWVCIRSVRARAALHPYLIRNRNLRLRCISGTGRAASCVRHSDVRDV